MVGSWGLLWERRKASLKAFQLVKDLGVWPVVLLRLSFSMNFQSCFFSSRHSCRAWESRNRFFKSQKDPPWRGSSPWQWVILMNVFVSHSLSPLQASPPPFSRAEVFLISSSLNCALLISSYSTSSFAHVDSHPHLCASQSHSSQAFPLNKHASYLSYLEKTH